MRRLTYLSNVSTLRLDPSRCTGCGVCTQVCARAVLQVEDRKVRIVDLDACIECGACMKNCTRGALQVQAGVGCANALILEALRGRSAQGECC